MQAPSLLGRTRLHEQRAPLLLSPAGPRGSPRSRALTSPVRPDKAGPPLQPRRWLPVQIPGAEAPCPSPTPRSAGPVPTWVPARGRSLPGLLLRGRVWSSSPSSSPFLSAPRLSAGQEVSSPSGVPRRGPVTMGRNPSRSGNHCREEVWARERGRGEGSSRPS